MRSAFHASLILILAAAGAVLAQQGGQQGAQKGASSDAPKAIYSPKSVADGLKTGEGAVRAAMISQGSDHLVAAGRRESGAVAERHDKAYDIVMITEGEAVYVTGGTLKDSRETRPGEMLGGTIEGGETHILKAGDTIVVPPGVPHWWKETSGVSYMIMKVIQP